MNEKTYTVEEVANLFKISKHTVYELIKRGEINAYKVGNKMRMDEQDVENFKKKRQTKEHNTVPIPSNTPLPHERTIRLAGSHDFILEQLTNYINQRPNSLQIQPTVLGSLEGLMMLYRGIADVAAIHLLDPNTNEYNLPFVKQFFVAEKVTVVHLAERAQGLIVAKNNPKNIVKLTDLSKHDITFINRQRGSGTRFLFDTLLTKNNIKGKEIRGYEQEEWNHLAAASYVSRNAADVTFGIRAAADHLNLDFIPIAQEQFDLVFYWKAENEAILKDFYNHISSSDFQKCLSDAAGYNITKLGKIVYKNNE